ncbi:uncharacterized protein ACA1_042810 [Acanthamoeba castellanii str. Neff]|uniref:Uncharacterized protein n=1 Tax=Acanthamoeba castellanii (strain ATCC 30010 / Neff) TaxID=1257118 RepID=L8GV57_ACACF|nr:uncharacterized protein ACA1_042810 [Acanthamoeba castellanii str. Neff]ELR16890.1 hypothetical protein ACA1_042810 [Acanthamoeba castellanii str. Neff]
MKKNTEGSLPRWVLLAVCMAFFASAAQSAYIAKELINDTSNSFIISQGDGSTASDNTGFSMASGDFDGDGYEDALIGAYNYNDDEDEEEEEDDDEEEDEEEDEEVDKQKQVDEDGDERGKKLKMRKRGLA